MRQTSHGVEDRFALESTLELGTTVAGACFLIGGAVPLLSETVANFIDEDIPGLVWLAIMMVGVVVVGYRRGAIVDRTTQTVTRWWGMSGLPLYRQEQPLDAYAVQIRKVTEIADNGVPHIKYPVALLSSGRRIVLAAGHSITNTWTIATRLAAFLDIDLEDETEADVVGTNPFGG